MLILHKSRQTECESMIFSIDSLHNVFLPPISMQTLQILGKPYIASHSYTLDTMRACGNCADIGYYHILSKTPPRYLMSPFLTIFAIRRKQTNHVWLWQTQTNQDQDHLPHTHDWRYGFNTLWHKPSLNKCNMCIFICVYRRGKGGGGVATLTLCGLLQRVCFVGWRDGGGGGGRNQFNFHSKCMQIEFLCSLGWLKTTDTICDFAIV